MSPGNLRGVALNCHVALDFWPATPSAGWGFGSVHRAPKWAAEVSRTGFGEGPSHRALERRIMPFDCEILTEQEYSFTASVQNNHRAAPR